MKRFLIASTLCLAGCVSGGGVPRGNPPAKVLLGAHVAPNGGASREADVLALEAQIGRKLDLDKIAPDFLWTVSYVSRFQWDATNSRIPYILWSPRQGTGCVLLSDVVTGKYDAQIDAQANQIAALGAPVWIGLFSEPTVTTSGRCSNPNRDPTLYKAAYAHVVAIFQNDGVVNVKWVFALDSTEFAEGLYNTWRPATDILGEDVYDATGVAEDFSAAVCNVGPQLGIPFAITETGAPPSNQTRWISTYRCPGALAYIYFDMPAYAPYQFASPQAVADFVAIGQ